MRRLTRRTRVLVAGSNSAAIATIEAALSAGHDVLRAADAASARAAVDYSRPDAVVLDLELVDEGGRELWATLWRGRRRRAPTVLVTRYAAGVDQAEAFRGRADDYLVEPFDAAEVVFRVNGLLRHRAPARGSIVRVGDLEIDADAGRVTRGGKPLGLAPAQVGALVALATKPGQLWTPERLARAARLQVSPGADVEATVRAAVSRLRHRIEPIPSRPLYLHTVRERGYVLEWRPEGVSADRPGLARALQDRESA